MKQILYPCLYQVNPGWPDTIQLKDLLGSASYTREGNDLLERGLYLDMEPWSYHVFNMEISQ